MALSNWNRHGLRNPYAQIAPSLPGWPANGLSAGIEPSLLIRRIFPCGLLRSWALRPVAVVADREVQLAVRPEPDAAADVQQLRRRGGPEQLERTVGADVLGRAEPDQVVQQVVPRVIEVDVVVGHAEVGVERDADQPAVAGVLRRQVGERGRQQLPVLDDLDLPAALQDEDPAVRRDLETRRAVQAVADHQRGLEVLGRRGGSPMGAATSPAVISARMTSSTAV